MVESRRHRFVRRAKEVLVDARVEGFEGDAVPRDDEVGDVAGPPVEHGDTLGVDDVERAAGAGLGLEKGPGRVAAPLARWAGKEVELRQVGTRGRRTLGGRWGGGEDVDVVAAAGEGGVKSEGVALHAAGGGGDGPFPREDCDPECGGRGAVAGEFEGVPGEVYVPEVTGPWMSFRGGGVGGAGGKRRGVEEDKEKEGEGEEEEEGEKGGGGEHGGLSGPVGGGGGEGHQRRGGGRERGDGFRGESERNGDGKRGGRISGGEHGVRLV